MASCYLAPLTINGTPLPDSAQWSARWDESPITGSTVQRLCTGAGVLQTTWRKRRLTISAEGSVPPALQAINWTLPVSISGHDMTPMTGFSQGPQTRFDAFAALWSWQLTLEEM